LSDSPTGSALGLDFGPDSEIPTSPMSTVTYPLPSTAAIAGGTRRGRISGHGRHATHDSHSYLRRQRGPSHSSIHGTLSPPMNATVASLAGAGFQIGLSPLSPGFSIVPLDRRRRISNLGVASTSGGNRRPGGDLERRRTVSEGDSRTLGSGSHGRRHTTVPDDHQEEVERGYEEEEVGVVTGKGKGNGRKRWKWLRKLTLRN